MVKKGGSRKYREANFFCCCLFFADSPPDGGGVRALDVVLSMMSEVILGKFDERGFEGD